MMHTMLVLTGLMLTATPESVDEQVARGAKLYGEHCAKCHGDAGQGTDKGPAVVGKGALPKDPPADRKFRKTQFRTAADVFDFVAKAMPAKNPEKVSATDKAAILAFDLKANGVKLDKVVTREVAEKIVLHP
jgi:cytochrome c